MLLLLLVAGVLCVSVHCVLQANLAVQEGRLSVAMGELRVAQAQLDDKQRELDEVQAMYDAAMKEKQTLLDNAETCRRKMQAASALINGLGGEKERWTAQSKEFQSQIGRYMCSDRMPYQITTWNAASFTSPGPSIASNQHAVEYRLLATPLPYIVTNVVLCEYSCLVSFCVGWWVMCCLQRPSCPTLGPSTRSSATSSQQAGKRSCSRRESPSQRTSTSPTCLWLPLQ